MPRDRFIFIDPKKQAIAFLTHIEAGIAVPDQWQFSLQRRDLGNVVGDRIMMFHPGHRQPCPSQCCYFISPESRRIDDVFCRDLALLCRDDPAAVQFLVQRANAAMFPNFRPPPAASAAGKGLRQT